MKAFHDTKAGCCESLNITCSDESAPDSGTNINYTFSSVTQLCNEAEANTTAVHYSSRKDCCEKNIAYYASHNCKNNNPTEPCYKRDNQHVGCEEVDDTSICQELNGRASNVYYIEPWNSSIRIFSDEAECCSHYAFGCGTIMNKCYRRSLDNSYLCEEELDCVSYPYNKWQFHETFDECCNDDTYPQCANVNITKEDWYENNSSCYKPINEWSSPPKHECTKETVFEQCWEGSTMYPTSLDVCQQEVSLNCQKIVPTSYWNETGFQYCSEKNMNCVDNSIDKTTYNSGIEDGWTCVNPCEDQINGNNTHAVVDPTIYYPTRENWPLRKCKYNDPLVNPVITCHNSNVGDMITVRGDAYFVVSRNMLVEIIGDSLWPIGSVCTSLIKNMSGLFHNANENTDYNITMWDTSSVTDMSYMFANASLFNTILSNWNTSLVTNMSHTFANAISYNQNLYWNTSLVTDMSGMFRSATAFNQNISNWNTTSVTNMGSIIHWRYWQVEHWQLEHLISNRYG